MNEITDMNITYIISAFIVLMNLILTGYLIETLRRGGMGKRPRFIFAFILLVWLSILAERVYTSGLLPNDISGTGYFLNMVGGIGIMMSVIYVVPSIRKALLAVPYELLLLPQGLRVFFGAVFIVSASLGALPEGFGILDGVTHIAAAFLALKAGLLWAHGERKTGALWFASIFGLVDIVCVGLGLAFVLLPEITPNHNIALAAFYAAPIFVTLHGILIWRLLKEK